MEEGLIPYQNLAIFMSFGCSLKVDYVRNNFIIFPIKLSFIYSHLIDSIHYFSTEILFVKFIERLCLRTVLC